MAVYSALRRFTKTTPVISDRKLIEDLLDKQSNIYSHRPESIVARLITQGDHLLIMDYGETWRKIRKLVHQYFIEPMCEEATYSYPARGGDSDDKRLYGRSR